MRLGAVDHLAKPVGREALATCCAHAARAGPAAGTLPDGGHEGDLIGSSAAMREVQKSIGLLADSDATVLLLGETGTGKEVVARAIHRHGSRAGGPFVPVNCAAIPTELLESLLFGHVRGAFTGAVADRAGSFREAQRGTLFLDEIGDMDLAMQAKLLRVLQDRVVTPVGGKPVAIDVRVIAATHRDLQQAVRAGTFREDLYYRIGVVPVSLPPLRSRLADIIPLAEHFPAPCRAATGASGPTRPPACSAIAGPATSASCVNAMKRAATLARRPVLSAADLDFLSAGARPAPSPAMSTGWPERCRTPSHAWRRRCSAARWTPRMATARKPPRCSASGGNCSTTRSTATRSNLEPARNRHCETPRGASR